MHTSMRRERRGFALIASLWLLVALSALGIQLSLEARGRRLAAANVIEGSQARAAATAGAEQARARLTRLLVRANPPGGAPVVQDPWAELAGVLPDTVTMGASRYRVRLADANAALNINRAEEAELRRLFIALRIDAGDADRVAQAIADWRDADDARRARGAERETYERERLEVLPANAPFRTIAELRDVRGMTDAIYRTVRPFLTTHGSGLVNLNAAPRPVALAIAGMTDEAVLALQRARDAGLPLRSAQELALALSPGGRSVLQAGEPGVQARASFDTREVAVESEGWTTGSPMRVLASGLAVRAGASAFFVARRSE